MKYAHNFKDWTGKTVGPFLVIQRTGITKSGNVIWKVKCTICNNESTRKIDCLTFRTKACQKCTKHLHGSNHTSWKGIGKLSHTHFNRIKKSAKKRNIKFTVNITYLWDLFTKQNSKCALSNELIYFGPASYNKYEYTTASLDRINSDKGYVKGNVQWVHKDINLMKNQLSQETFISLCKQVSVNN